MKPGCPDWHRDCNTRYGRWVSYPYNTMVVHVAYEDSYSLLDVRGMRWTAHWIHFPAIAEAIWIAYQANQGRWYTTYRYFISQVSSLIWSWWAPFWGCILSDLVHWAAMSSLYIRYSISFDELMQITDIKLLSAAPCLTLGLDVS